jgi:hypothetical protein
MVTSVGRRKLPSSNFRRLWSGRRCFLETLKIILADEKFYFSYSGCWQIKIIIFNYLDLDQTKLSRNYQNLDSSIHAPNVSVTFPSSNINIAAAAAVLPEMKRTG